ncbi:MAG: flagellar hook-associated protein FlgK [Nocardioides sp.]
MSGTFSSLSSALSAMRYNQVAMDVASGNVANAQTPGYTRRQVIGQATGAPAVPAVWSRWEGAGDGVQAGPVTRMVDPLLDARARTEHASSHFLGTRAASLVRFETTLGEPGDNGVAAALASFKQGWHDVANNPGDEAARSQLIARGQTLADAVGSQARAVSTEWSDQRSRLDALGDEVNKAAAQLASLNTGLRTADNAGTDATNLLDQRDQLTLRLAELTGAQVKINPDSTVEVTVAGQTLVSGNNASAFTVSGSPDLAGAAGSPVTVTVGGTQVDLTSGEVGGTMQVLGTDLPDYMTQLDSVVSTLASQVNTQHQAGKDLDGNPGAAFFSGTTAATLSVAITDPRQVAAADPAKGALDASNADALAGLDMGAAAYRQLITRFGVTVSSAKQVSANQDVVAAQVDASRESLSGVSVDEEMVNLLAAQRGYEGAARVLTTLDSVLDTLINRTAVH